MTQEEYDEQMRGLIASAFNSGMLEIQMRHKGSSVVFQDGLEFADAVLTGTAQDLVALRTFSPPSVES